MTVNDYIGAAPRLKMFIERALRMMLLRLDLRRVTLQGD